MLIFRGVTTVDPGGGFIFFCHWFAIPCSAHRDKCFTILCWHESRHQHGVKST